MSFGSRILLLNRPFDENTTSENCTVHNSIQIPITIEKDCPLMFYLFPQTMSLIYFSLCSVGILANIFEVTVFLNNITTWKTSGIALINLAFADIITLFSFLPYTVYLNVNYNWTMGKLMCQITMSNIILGITGNTTFICALSLDRFIAIVFPIRFRNLRTVKNAWVLSVVLWMVASVMPLLVFPNVQYKIHRGRDGYCGTQYNLQNDTAPVFLSSLFYIVLNLLVPLIILVVTYILIVRTLQQFYKRKRATGNKEKTMKLISSVIALYLFCWLPSQLLSVILSGIYQSFVNCKNICMLTQIGNSFSEISNFLTIFNACIDPLVYRLSRGFSCCNFKLKCRDIMCCPSVSQQQLSPSLV
ncbi:type-1 angiotensin II receptor-like isoform X2 [Acipenser ruthenus]|nr:type-1 angiotensin II receptor-like isoform X2 [Acipenser ruthenus]